MRSKRMDKGQALVEHVSATSCGQRQADSSTASSTPISIHLVGKDKEEPSARDWRKQ